MDSRSPRTPDPRRTRPRPQQESDVARAAGRQPRRPVDPDGQVRRPVDRDRRRRPDGTDAKRPVDTGAQQRPINPDARRPITPDAKRRPDGGGAKRPVDPQRKPRRPRPDPDRQRPQRIPTDGEIRRSSGEVHTRDPRRGQAPRPGQAKPKQARRQPPPGATASPSGTGKPNQSRPGAPSSRPNRPTGAPSKSPVGKPVGPKPAQPVDTPPPTSPPASTALAAIPPRGRLAGRAVVAALSAVVLLACGYTWNTVRDLNGDITQLAGLNLGSGDDGAVDVLLVGTDSRTDAKGNPLSQRELRWLRTGNDVTTSTDTIVLVRIPNNGSSATAVSIPRDTYVSVPGIGMSKINAAYGATREHVRRTEVEKGTDPTTAETDGIAAGRKALVQTVADLTGVQVDHYAEVGLLGFALLTDAVGGVDVCLKAAVREPLSGARFKAGRQTLSGGKALSFVRQRHELPRGDLDRITRQQVFMASLAQKILSTNTLTDSDKLAKLQQAIGRSVIIDDNWDILSFAEQLKDLSGGNVTFSTIPVVTEQGWSDDGTQSVVQVDPTEVKKFTERLLGGGERAKTGFDRGDYVVDVVNAGTIDGLAGNVANILSSKGFQSGKTSTSRANDRDSVVYTHATGEASTTLARDLGITTIREDPTLGENTMRVVLTNTFEGPGSIADTGPQSAASQAAATAKPKAPAPISAGTSGPVCVN